MAIDTGSDELWVNPTCESRELIPEQVAECKADGQYSSNSSSSAVAMQQTKFIPYGKGNVTIQYVSDDIALPGSDIGLKGVQFGTAIKSNELSEGIMGLAYGKGTNLNYDNFVDQLALQKVTNSKAFSVALGSVDANNGGVVIFGGVDTKKFSGKLVSNKILGPQGQEPINRYWIQMTSVALDTSGTSKTYSGGNVPVVLDSGSSLSYLPRSIVTAMASDFEGKLDRYSGFYLVPCSQAAKTGSIDFTFGSATIRVPFREFIWNAEPDVCVLGALAVEPGSGVTPLLGDTFMRSAFVVFDQSQNTISMAQYVNCGQNEQNITISGVDGLAGECPSPVRNAGARIGSSSTSLIAVLLVTLLAMLF